MPELKEWMKASKLQNEKKVFTYCKLKTIIKSSKQIAKLNF